MKIAVITEDEVTISQHFGRAPFYLVFTIVDGKVVGKEKREKIGHNHFSGQEPGGHHEHHHEESHGHDPASHEKHARMTDAISDCQALICGGMGMGAYESLRRLNITALVTDINDIDQAVQSYIEGKLVNHMERLH